MCKDQKIVSTQDCLRIQRSRPRPTCNSSRDYFIVLLGKSLFYVLIQCLSPPSILSYETLGISGKLDNLKCWRAIIEGLPVVTSTLWEWGVWSGQQQNFPFALRSSFFFYSSPPPFIFYACRACSPEVSIRLKDKSMYYLKVLKQLF